MATPVIPLKAYMKDSKVHAVKPFEPGDALPVEYGGTGASTKAGILKSIGAAPENHTHSGMVGAGGPRIFDEVAKGDYDSTNRDFRSSKEFIQSSVVVILNGIRLMAGEELDYVLLYPNIVRICEPLHKGDLLTISYDAVPETV